jgi:hypothetical protein
MKRSNGFLNKYTEPTGRRGRIVKEKEGKKQEFIEKNILKIRNSATL